MIVKAELINELKEFSKVTGIPLKEFVVLAGGSLVIQGLRESTGDIDTHVNPDVFNKIIDLVFDGAIKGEFIFEGGKNTCKVGNLSLAKYKDYFEFIEFEGIRITSNKENLIFYEYLNREKDQQWIKLLRGLVE